MCTAIVSLYMTEGFVIAADSRELSLAGGAPNDKVTKIFHIRDDKKALAYAFSGAVDLADPTGQTAFDFKQCAEKIHRYEAADPHCFDAYVRQFAFSINDHLKQEWGKYVSDCPVVRINDPGFLTEMIIVGYYRSYPWRAEVQFRCEKGGLLDPCFVGLVTAPMDFKIFSGSKEITRRLFGSETIPPDPNFAKYRTPCMVTQTAPSSLDEATKAAGNYIQACIDNRQIDHEHECDSIGGRVHITRITREFGTEWVIAPEPAPAEE